MKKKISYNQADYSQAVNQLKEDSSAIQLKLDDDTLNKTNVHAAKPAEAILDKLAYLTGEFSNYANSAADDMTTIGEKIEAADEAAKNAVGGN